MLRSAATCSAFLFLLAAACSGDDAAPENPTPELPSATSIPDLPSPTPTALPSSTPTPSPTTTQTAQEALKGRILDRFAAILQEGHPTIRSILSLASLEEMTWANSCLGVARPEETCEPGTVAGYEAIIHYRDELTYVLHVDALVDRAVWDADETAAGVVVEVTGSGWVIAGNDDLFTDTIQPGRIEVAIMDGTEFYTPKREVVGGTIVEFGVAGLPGSDVVALVWLRAR